MHKILKTYKVKKNLMRVSGSFSETNLSNLCSLFDTHTMISFSRSRHFLNFGLMAAIDEAAIEKRNSHKYDLSFEEKALISTSRHLQFQQTFLSCLLEFEYAGRNCLKIYSVSVCK